MARALSVDDAWNAVTLEERLELLERAKGTGLSAAIIFTFLIGSVAYGFDAIWLLGFGAVISVFVLQVFTSRTWRNERPQLIMSYLAVRSMARRYAYGYKIDPIDSVLTFRGTLRENFKSREEEEMHRQSQQVDFDTDMGSEREVWICLLRGGVVILSERIGGAKLEFIAAINPEMSIHPVEGDEHAPIGALVISPNGKNSARSVTIASRYRGALYVFEKQAQRLVFEAREFRDRLEKLRPPATAR